MTRNWGIIYPLSMELATEPKGAINASLQILRCTDIDFRR